MLCLCSRGMTLAISIAIRLRATAAVSIELQKGTGMLVINPKAAANVAVIARRCIVLRKTLRTEPIQFPLQRPTATPTTTAVAE